MRNKMMIVLSVLFLSSCASEKTDTKEEETNLMNTSKAWSTAAQTKNIDDILSYWADDAVVYSPNQPPYEGKQAIRAMVEQSSNIPGFTISWEPLKATISESGDMGYLIEKNTVSFIDSTGNRLSETNRAVTIWRKDKDGKWKNVVEMWNAGAR